MLKSRCTKGGALVPPSSSWMLSARNSAGDRKAKRTICRFISDRCLFSVFLEVQKKHGTDLDLRKIARWGGHSEQQASK